MWNLLENQVSNVVIKLFLKMKIKMNTSLITASLPRPNRDSIRPEKCPRWASARPNSSKGVEMRIPEEPGWAARSYTSVDPSALLQRTSPTSRSDGLCRPIQGGIECEWKINQKNDKWSVNDVVWMMKAIPNDEQLEYTEECVYCETASCSLHRVSVCPSTRGLSLHTRVLFWCSVSVSIKLIRERIITTAAGIHGDALYLEI